MTTAIDATDAICGVDDVDLGRLAQVAEAFDLGSVGAVKVIAEGLMNRNWQVDTSRRGTVAVKQVRDVTAEAARRQHATTTALAARGLPVLAPMVTTTGDTLADVDGDVYAVATWARGVHREGLSLTVDEVLALGRLLANLHAGLAEVMPEALPTMRVSVAEPANAKNKIDRYEGLLAARVSHDEMDSFVATQLAERRALLETVGHLRPSDDHEVGPAGWCHGDFQHFNVLYGSPHADANVVAVLDWDRLGVHPLAAEVVRSATLLFGYGDDRGLDLERVAAFVGGYRMGAALSDQQVADAVHRLWWDRVCDFWQLRRRYEHGDTSCDHLFLSASALLWWWTGHRDDVRAAFTSR